jgi:very-short-patch-repair endonuclease
VTAHRLPAPRLNVEVAGLEVDAFWPQWGLVVELDGRAYHSVPGAFERDRVRDAQLQRAGHRVLRVTHKRLHTEPTQVLADVRAFAALVQPAPALVQPADESAGC